MGVKIAHVSMMCPVHGVTFCTLVKQKENSRLSISINYEFVRTFLISKYLPDLRRHQKLSRTFTLQDALFLSSKIQCGKCLR